MHQMFIQGGQKVFIDNKDEHYYCPRALIAHNEAAARVVYVGCKKILHDFKSPDLEPLCTLECVCVVLFY